MKTYEAEIRIYAYQVRKVQLKASTEEEAERKLDDALEADITPLGKKIRDGMPEGWVVEDISGELIFLDT